MRSSTVTLLIIGLAFCWLAVPAVGLTQDPDLKPEVSSEVEKPNGQPEESENSVEETEDDSFDVDPFDLDPLDILDSPDPLGKVGSLVDEISRNMKEIENLLEEEDTSEENQSIQQQTLSTIDELITEVQRLTGT
ncbi:MAG: hypothetical protein OSB09_07515 [Planctomycetota bacterium]|nr:hypothetical protein [Planctomycetota bacterium]